ncbi:MAG TPA: NepR family anti-sigma factor [Erythrobacter sp.]|nr:NepR family anti-sigma factor [Erythrobacter sp.]
MAADRQNSGKSAAPGDRGSQKVAPAKPDWADGLRALYDSVVHEPLPDSFMDLLDKLDDPPASDPR